MAFVCAKEDCYLNEYGYKAAGEVFEYAGPPHDSLENVKTPRNKPPIAADETGE